MSPSRPRADHPALGQVLAGRYRLEQPIASDPERSLWQGTDIVLTRSVAVRLGPPLPKAAAGLVHPNVVTIFDSGEDQGTSFTVLELVGGGSLADRLSRGPLDATEAVALGLQVAGALVRGHGAGLAHGALSQATILMARGRAKITPFAEAGATTEDMARDVLCLAEVLAAVTASPWPPGLAEVLSAAHEHGRAGDLAESLGELGLVDDAVDLAALDPTPPSGTAAIARPSRAPLGAGLAVLALVAMAAFAAFALARDSAGSGGESRLGDRTVVGIAATRSFDPLGDGSEHERDAPLSVDGNLATSWTTDRYRTRALGGLKPGVGLVLELAQLQEVTRLQLVTDGQGWSAEVFLAERAGADLASWGSPVAAVRGGRPTEVLDLRGRQAGAVLIWITDLGTGPDDFRFRLREATVAA